MFLFLLNSSGAIILFVYLLIAVSQVVLRRRTPTDKLPVKMWLFPVLSLLTIAAILGVLVQMGVDEDARSQLVLSLMSWAVVLVLYFASKMGGSISADGDGPGPRPARATGSWCWPTRQPHRGRARGDCPAGYPRNSGPIHRLSVSYGGSA